MTGNTYTFGKLINEGFFSFVYECTDVWNNRLAVKILKPSQPSDALREAAAHEFQTLLSLRHPNITFVHDAFEFESAFFVVTERCEYTLEIVLSLEKPEEPLWLMPVARCLLQAVHYLHINGFAHQDIHPGNVMAAYLKDEIAPNQPEAIHFKLCDFGITRVLSELAATELRKVSIMPPEVIDPKTYGPLDHRIDIYHVGLVLLQLAHSTPLTFTRDEILAGNPRQMALQLAAPYATALEKALRRHASFRTASAMELWRDLNSPSPGLGWSGRSSSRSFRRVPLRY
jgi:serine/threonine-protein kinase